MEKPRFHLQRRLFVATGLLVAASGVWYFWTWYRTPSSGVVARQPTAFVQVAGQGEGNADQVMQERAELLDPTPLFIPTGKNFGQGELPARVVRQPGQVFGDYEAKMDFSDSGLATYGAAVDPTPDSLPEVLGRGNEAPFAGFGQIDTSRSPLAIRAGMIEVKSFTDGNIVISHAISDLILPKTDFAPAEFIVAVGNSGLLGEPVLTTSSGSEENDAVLREFLDTGFRLGERLPPGRYVVAIGP
ncbi:MAG: hypothetical protein ACHQ5A_00780 [Opitutales bacterium]